MADCGTCADLENECLHVNKQLSNSISSQMPPIRTRQSCGQYYTPPPDFSAKEGQANTPQRSAVIFAKYLSQETKIPIPQSTIRRITNLPERTQTRILAEKEVRTLHNRQDLRPDPRGRKRAILRLDSATISDYLDNPTVPLDDRGKPWLDLAEDAGIHLPKTQHFKPPGIRTVEPQTV